MDMYNFYTGKTFDAYLYFGCHYSKGNTIFRTFVPNAEKLAIIGDFNNWQETPMDKIHDTVWECSIKNVKIGDRYKLRIYRKYKSFLDHCDPYGFGMTLRPDSCSVVRNLNSYKFNDAKWLRKRTSCINSPLNIYEIHLGSWKTNNNQWYNYTELARLLVPYLKEMGYNYVEFLPIGEHPSDNSWGYQQTGFYSPTSRYGTMDQLKKMIDILHQNNIGVILDFVPVHFAVDDYALAEFDGTPIYEYPYSDIGYNQWGSKNFNYSRGEVRSFMQSCANYWLKEYHFDGLRMDAVNNLIYWQGNEKRGINKNAVDFIRTMNKGLKELHPNIILSAEDSSSYTGVTQPIENNGLGFDYKWNMGWMNDTLSYFKTNSNERSKHYHKLTFSMLYYYKEKFLLPLSHDEVVHSKGTIIEKMNGNYEEKFAQARSLYLYMYAHQGKKLNFMGNEFAQFREWNEKRQQDWEILKYPKHNSFHQYIKDLNHFYLRHSALWELDFSRCGFQWLECNQESKNIYVFKRCSKTEEIIFAFNLSSTAQSYTLKAQNINILFSTNSKEYGSSTPITYYSSKSTQTTTLNLPAFSGCCISELNSNLS